MKPLILIILDGWGIRKQKKGNAIKLGKTPNFDMLKKKYPYTQLKASGKAVGLLQEMMGNSETGHLNLGAGRIVVQDIKRISDSIKNKSFFKNKSLLKAVNNAKKNNSTLHIMGLLSPAGVHAYIPHLYALIKLASQHKLKKVMIHVFTDGRDTPIKSAKGFVRDLLKQIKKYKTGKIATITGRYYAMDRDNRWDRTKTAYDALANRKGTRVRSALKGIDMAYKKGETDEFIRPLIIDDFNGINDKDSVIFFNYRTDRPRQLTKAFIESGFKKFKRKKLNVVFACMTEYYKGTPNIAFDTLAVKNNLGKIISRKGLRQLRIAETEKYAHVTFFFNSQIEKPFKKEDRIMVPSPKVATYDLKPEMSAYKIKNKVINEINKDKYDVIILNFANADMVGHTGRIKPTIKAVETVDKCLGKVVGEILSKNGAALIIADHGNAEDMTGKELSTHTTNPVPCILVSGRKCRLKKGILADIAPTMLSLLNIQKPKEMTGKNLI